MHLSACLSVHLPVCMSVDEGPQDNEISFMSSD